MINLSIMITGLLLGVGACIIPIIGIFKFKANELKCVLKYATISFMMCVTSVWLQILFERQFIERYDWVGLMDTFDAVLGGSMILIVMTIILNIIMIRIHFNRYTKG